LIFGVALAGLAWPDAAFAERPIFLGAAAAVIFSIVGVRILVSSAVQSSYVMAQGILALLAAGVGVLIALGGPGLAGMLIDAGKDAVFDTAITYSLTLASISMPSKEFVVWPDMTSQFQQLTFKTL
jgi:hypothetical protein